MDGCGVIRPGVDKNAHVMPQVEQARDLAKDKCFGNDRKTPEQKSDAQGDAHVSSQAKRFEILLQTGTCPRARRGTGSGRSWLSRNRTRSTANGARAKRAVCAASPG